MPKLGLRDTITEYVEIVEAQEQKDGQWRLKFNVPSMYSKFPTGPCWKPVKDGEKIFPGTWVNVVLVRGSRQNNEYGDIDWGYFFELAKFDEEVVSTNGPTPLPQSEPKASTPILREEPRAKDVSLDLRIAWNSAVNNAVHLHGPNADLGYIGASTYGIDFKAILMYACTIYDMIVAGVPERPDPTTIDPMSDRAPDMAPEPPRMAAQAAEIEKKMVKPTPVGSPRKLGELEVCRFSEDGKELFPEDYLAGFIADTYGEDQTKWTLNNEELDEVMAAMKTGLIEPWPEVRI